MKRQRFSSAAKTYDLHARPQQSLAERVLGLLPSSYHPQSILELGAGTGLLTSMLTERFPDTPLEAVDLSEEMLAVARQKLADYSQISWTVADAQSYSLPSPVSLIISSAALHWVTHPQKTFEMIFKNLQPGGFFALGIMVQGTLGELHALRREIAPKKAPPLLLPNKKETINALSNAGFQLLKEKETAQQVVYPDAWTFLRILHEQGVTGGSFSAGSTPLNRRELFELADRYAKAYSVEKGGVWATYQTISLLLQKPTDSTDL